VAKGWSLFFGVVMLACLGMFVAAPFVDGWWLPEQLSAHAPDIDRLFYIILAITGFFFVLTELLLVVFMWQYAGKPGEKEHVFGHHAAEKKVFWTSFFKRLFRPVSAVLHDQHRVELAWTLVPAAILLYIAFAQVGTWAEAKYKERRPTATDGQALPVQAAVSARQFEWRVRYPSFKTWERWKANPALAKGWATNPHFDDVHVVNELHVIKGRPALATVSTLDVIHSFNLPHMRVKQDALPGRHIQTWFTPVKSNTIKGQYPDGTPRWEDGGGFDEKGRPRDKKLVWEIACAELCGWGHFRMTGKVFVHQDEQDFEDWLKHASAESERRSNEAR
jgi:cytochrome c oxidase subunit 2